ncbi:MAG: T3SS (YopN, CesT) and YbjN peptide-binding chaperone 1 [Aeromicrobium sp.]
MKWAERFVDREIDDAWRAFRRLVTHVVEAALEADGRGEWVFTPQTAAASQPVTLSVDDWSDIDRAVADVIAELRDELHVVHPSFVDWTAEGVEQPPLPVGRALPPEPLQGVRSDVWTGLTHEWLVEHVDDLLAERLGHPPIKKPSGSIALRSGRTGRVCMVRVEKMRVDLWTGLADGIIDPASIDGAAALIPDLRIEYPTFTFEVGNAVLLASTFVDGVTFVPDQLTRAINNTFALASDHEKLGDYLRSLVSA